MTAVTTAAMMTSRNPPTGSGRDQGQSQVHRERVASARVRPCVVVDRAVAVDRRVACVLHVVVRHQDDLDVLLVRAVAIAARRHGEFMTSSFHTRTCCMII